MGIDYDAEFGFGIKVGSIKKEQEIEGVDEEIDRYEILDDLLRDSDYVYTQSGAGDYTGEENTWYVFDKAPFKNGFDLTSKAEAIKTFCKEKGIEIDGEVGIHGGVHMC